MFPLNEENRCNMISSNDFAILIVYNSYLGPQIWEILPLDWLELKQTKSLS